LLFQACVKEFNPSILSGHFHDTRAMALANVYAALTQGIRKFDSCIGGWVAALLLQERLEI